MNKMRVHCMSGKKYDVYCGRKNPKIKADEKWGNPFIIGRDGDRETVIRKHKEMFLANEQLIWDARHELKGKVVSCWCQDHETCHTDILVEVANATEREVFDKYKLGSICTECSTLNGVDNPSWACAGCGSV